MTLMAFAIFPAACGGDDGPSQRGAGIGGSAGAAGEAGSAGVAGTAGEAGSGGASGAPAVAFVDLRADSNRNGTIDLADPSEDEDEETWDASHGAIFLANLDDDEVACPVGGSLSDEALASCHDAADDVINGDDDLLDLARLRTAPWPEAPDGASGRIEVASPGRDFVRLFVRRGDFTVLAPDATLTAEEIRSGVELAIEGKDIVRDPSKWDGYVDITLHVEGAGVVAGQDTVRMRVAPVILSHHLQPMEKLYATRDASDPDAIAFLTDLEAAATAAGVPGGLEKLQVPDYDQWTQDLFETGAMTMPASGEPHAMRVFVRSAGLDGWAPGLRAGSRIVFTHFRGKDAAGIQQADLKHDIDMDTLDSFGNTETIPPHTHGGASYPLGRILRGSIPSFHPDPTMSLLLGSQAVQPVLTIDTSWLYVAHVDETLSFIKVDSPLGFAVIVNDPALARTMLEEASANGFGKESMFVGLSWIDDNWEEFPAEVTITQVLKDADVMAMSAQATVEIEAQLARLRQEVGITEQDIIRVPFLHDEVWDLAIAYQPGTVNGVVLSDTDFAAPDPHGPVIDGEDMFRRQMRETFEARGITVHFVEDWNLYHRLEGEVHCGSNALRALPAVNWWETGR
jgi:protein-arginine deiminase